MKILVVGGGGREHAIIRALKKSPRCSEIWCAPGNGGISYDAHCKAIPATDVDAMVKFAKEEAFDYVVVAQDDPLALGMVDALAAVGIPAFGPDKAAARIEASKVFSKDLMKKYGIPTAKYETFDDPEKVMDYIKAEGKYPVVIKADGLALGKGVLICQNEQEAADGVKEIMLDKKFGASGNHVVVEEFLTGPEVSVLAFCRRQDRQARWSRSMDHKRALDRDEGLNTGGMGTVAPNPYYTPAVAAALHGGDLPAHRRGHAGRGLPLQGLPLLRPDADPRRPEGHRVQLPLRRPRDAGRAAPAGKRPADRDAGHNERHAGQDRCANSATARRPASSWPAAAIPVAYEKGKEITGLTAGQLDAADVTVYHAGTAIKDGRLVTNGGRVLGVTATANTLPEALKKAYAATESIHFDKLHKRSDIGARALAAMQ